MALDARQRQKKAEKRKAKEREKRKELARRKATDDVGQRLARVAAAPILHCCTTQDLWDRGIAQVLVSRELTSGQVAFAIFLVDRYCLGVKDAFGGFMARGEYFDRLYERVAATGDVVALEPAAARKLVEGAVAYARDLGFSPPSDYERARQIFGAIDPAASDREFEFGKDGKPFFISGPHDSPGRCASIVGILNQRCGTGGFDYLVGIPGPMLLGADDDSKWDDQEDVMDDSDDVVEGIAAESSPPLPTRLAAGIRRMIFGNE
jgi:hypothetical protein